jgi:hypothetical protein
MTAAAENAQRTGEETVSKTMVLYLVNQSPGGNNNRKKYPLSNILRNSPRESRGSPRKRIAPVILVLITFTSFSVWSCVTP